MDYAESYSKHEILIAGKPFGFEVSIQGGKTGKVYTTVRDLDSGSELVYRHSYHAEHRVQLSAQMRRGLVPEMYHIALSELRAHVRTLRPCSICGGRPRLCRLCLMEEDRLEEEAYATSYCSKVEDGEWSLNALLKKDNGMTPKKKGSDG